MKGPGAASPSLVSCLYWFRVDVVEENKKGRKVENVMIVLVKCCRNW